MRPWRAGQRELVAAVLLERAVPVEVVLAERGHHDDARCDVEVDAPGSSKPRARASRSTCRSRGRRGAVRCCPVAGRRLAEARRKKVMRAVVVDLPLVPVIATTRSRSASCSQRLSAEVTVTPRASSARMSRATTGDAGALQDDVAGGERLEAAVGRREHAGRRVLVVVDDDEVARGRRVSPPRRDPRHRSRRCPTRWPARSAKPVGRNTAGSLGLEQFVEGSIGTGLMREAASQLDVTPLVELAHLRQRDGALVGVAHALEGLARRRRLRRARAAARRAPGRSRARGGRCRAVSNARETGRASD